MMSTSKRGRWMIGFMACLHASWGLILCLTPLPDAAARAGIPWAIYANVIGVEFWRTVMLLAATCAALSLRLPSHSRLALWLLLPQQTLLVMSLVGAIGVHFGMFGWGLPPSRVWGQTTDGMLRFTFHTLAALDRHAPGGLPGVRDGCLRAVGLR